MSKGAKLLEKALEDAEMGFPIGIFFKYFYCCFIFFGFVLM